FRLSPLAGQLAFTSLHHRHHRCQLRGTLGDNFRALGAASMVSKPHYLEEELDGSVAPRFNSSPMALRILMASRCQSAWLPAILAPSMQEPSRLSIALPR